MLYKGWSEFMFKHLLLKVRLSQTISHKQCGMPPRAGGERNAAQACRWLRWTLVQWMITAPLVSVGPSGCAAEMQSSDALAETLSVSQPSAPTTAPGPADNNKPTDQSVSEPNAQDTPVAQENAGTIGLQSSTKPVSLNFTSLSGDAAFLKETRKIAHISKPQQGSQIFMQCDGMTWGYEEATGKIVEINPPRSRLFDRITYDCMLQTSSGEVWLFGSSGSDHSLSYATFSTSESEQKLADVTTVPLHFSGKTSTRPQPLSVNSSEVIYFFEGSIQMYRLSQKRNGSKSSLKVTQVDWDTSTRGSPVAAGSIGEEFWVATKEKLFWLRQADAKNKNKAEYVWQNQALTLAPYTRQELGAMFFKSMALYIEPSESSLMVFGRASILLADKVLMTPDQTWEAVVKGLATTTCETCHAKNSKRTWKDSLSYASWTGSWREELLSHIEDKTMPPAKSTEASKLSDDNRKILVNWLKGMKANFSGQVVGTFTPPEPTAPAPTQPPASGPTPGVDLEPFRSEWASTIDPLLRTACSQCHTSTSSTRIDTLEWFATNITKVIASLDGTGALPMPPQAQNNFPASQAATVLNFASRLESASPGN